MHHELRARCTQCFSEALRSAMCSPGKLPPAPRLFGGFVQLWPGWPAARAPSCVAWPVEGLGPEAPHSRALSEQAQAGGVGCACSGGRTRLFGCPLASLAMPLGAVANRSFGGLPASLRAGAPQGLAGFAGLRRMTGPPRSSIKCSPLLETRPRPHHPDPSAPGPASLAARTRVLDSLEVALAVRCTLSPSD